MKRNHYSHTPTVYHKVLAKMEHHKGQGGLSFRVGYASKRFFGDLKTVFIIFLEWIVFGLTEK